MRQRLLLVGASGLAREVLAAGLQDVVGLLDDDLELHGTDVSGVPVVGSVSSAAQRDEALLVCVGPSAGRRHIVQRLSRLGVRDSRYATYLAPSARIGESSTVGHGSIVLDNVVVTADAFLGRHVVVMPNCTITHDDVVEDFSTLAAGVTLGGAVRIHEAAYIGMNASVRQGLTVGADAQVGMGTVVLENVPGKETWVGVPARPIGVNA
ncbi:acetyltransferase [Streptomyces sp. SID6673]|nr:acetyltransferase [Streptomyces sp. SID11726]NEB27412.1 acetyltransferase [Streptomyces sp. SID6673]